MKIRQLPAPHTHTLNKPKALISLSPVQRCVRVQLFSSRASIRLCSAIFSFLTSWIPNAFPTFLFGMKSNILYSIFFTSVHIGRLHSTIFPGDIILIIKAIDLLRHDPNKEDAKRHANMDGGGKSQGLSPTQNYRELRNAESRRNGPPQGRAR